MNKQFDAIVICSTLNQMVNYIPIVLHKINFNGVYSISMEGSGNKFVDEKFNYEKWDKNLEAVMSSTIQGEHKIIFKKSEISNHKNIIQRLGSKDLNLEEKLKGKKALWNITGGQRHFVMAITEFVFQERPNDTIMYYDGDNEEIYYYNKNEKIPPMEILKQNLDCKISISKALSLMGFHVKQKQKLDEPSKYYKDMKLGKHTTEHEWYTNFYKIYCNKNNEELRKILINSNRFQNDKGKNARTVLDKIVEEVESSNLSSEIKEMFRGNNEKVLKNSILKHDRGKVFGYMFEKMTLYNLIDVIEEDEDNKFKNTISDIDADISIDDGNSDLKESLDQFDVMMTTRAGKVVMFECKSGSMAGDTAKSNNYSTYAISGVYGTPIIVIPILCEDDISSNPVCFNTKVKRLGSSETDLEESQDLYGQVRSAYKSAERAFLKICCIDMLKNTLQEYIK